MVAPITQVTLRGFRKAPVAKIRVMWIRSRR